MTNVLLWGRRPDLVESDAAPDTMDATIGSVRLASGRGILGSIVWVIAYGFVFVPALLALLILLIRPELVTQAQAPCQLTPDEIWTNSVIIAFFGMMPLLYYWLVRPEAVAPRLLGLQWSPRVLPYSILGAGLGVATLLVLLIAADLLQLPASDNIRMDRALREQPILVFVIAATAAVFEEILFRGFLQARIGLPLASLLFGLTHIAYASFTHLVVAGLIGAFLGYLYVRTRILWVPILAHFAYDFVLLILVRGF